MAATAGMVRPVTDDERGGAAMSFPRPQAAAIFDLDRTLIAGPSGLVFARHLDAAGIAQRLIPGTDT